VVFIEQIKNFWVKLNKNEIGFTIS